MKTQSHAGKENSQSTVTSIVYPDNLLKPNPSLLCKYSDIGPTTYLDLNF